MKTYTICMNGKKCSYSPLILWHLKKTQKPYHFPSLIAWITIGFSTGFLVLSDCFTKGSFQIGFPQLLKYLIPFLFVALITYSVNVSGPAAAFRSLWYLWESLRREGTYLESVSFSANEIILTGYQKKQKFECPLSQTERLEILICPYGMILPFHSLSVYVPRRLFPDYETFQTISYLLKTQKGVSP